MNDMVNLKINGIAVSVAKGTTILEAAKSLGIDIPTLCYMKERNEIGACRICMVEANEGRGSRLVASCVYPVSEGMEVNTNSLKVQKARKTTLELILSTHDKKCLSCVRSGNCELQKLCLDYGIEDEDMINAVAYHTTGRAGMSKLEKIIFLADLTSAERSYPSADEVREIVDASLDEGMKTSLLFTMGQLLKNQQPICRDTWLAYNCYVPKYNQ